MVKIGVQPSLGVKGEQKEESTEVLISTIPDPKELSISQLKAKRLRSSGLCFLSFSLVIILCGLVLASFYFYKHYCISEDDSSREIMAECHLYYYDRGHDYYTLMEPPVINEDVQFNFADNSEVIFNENDTVRIVHDFQAMRTAFLDDTYDQCYIKPLNTKDVMPLQAFHDLLDETGKYLPDSYIIQEEFIITNEVYDIIQFGVTISRHCEGKKSFYLKQRSTRKRIDKREVNNCRTIHHFENTFGVETMICH